MYADPTLTPIPTFCRGAARGGDRGDYEEATNFYQDCVQTFDCPESSNPLGITIPLVSVKCPCKAAVEEFGDKLVVASNSPVFSDGLETACKPLSYYYDVAHDKWWKCCGRPDTSADSKVPLIGDLFSEGGDSASSAFPGGIKSFLGGVASPVINMAKTVFGGGMGKKTIQYCQEMRRVPGPGGAVAMLDGSEAKGGSVPEKPSYADTLMCMEPKFAKPLHMIKGDCVCWSGRKECIRIGKYGKRKPGLGHNYNVFFV
eukprot:CAMPEP_0178995294 /NCGR_PEP_ID=MMETSP0795-20121207/7756_1 /TAXON_ID=88552 /ORGANISM="Amoebophrya sp., Strain Ameob2" /LENGTH=257 /DNA_ID=CAMNT_0020687603 /DNA_START=42 /DNA_END=814 /DNA_ORIENTATION=-